MPFMAKSHDRLSAVLFRPTNTISLSASVISSLINLISLSLFSSSSLTISSFWVTVLAARRSSEPTYNWTGSVKYLVASLRTPSGHVALVITVCLSGRMSSKIFIICGSKPMSSIRSASSSTNMVTLVTFTILADIRSYRRPGVAIIISTPLVHTLTCSLRNRKKEQNTLDKIEKKNKTHWITINKILIIFKLTIGNIGATKYVALCCILTLKALISIMLSSKTLKYLY
ncbi:hypothetical protein BpHYR1_025289 [Brachionus plicatilis]|uniref:Uncharacterized protein n=1 Tax=Brachionus plicatilis TaxID=10195 RepID=A0A3M7RH71_BRAPC|nr:hypothetical protein BpHYR1_025289 [Brachionus plicatilis]